MAAPRTGREKDLPQRSTSRSKQQRRGKDSLQHGQTKPQDTLGQFSFGPTTQTTVVTTTTTTTTKFPPFLMRAPRRATQLDAKLYPLATTPTPVSLKKIRFLHQGRPAVFQEAPDTSIALLEVSSCSQLILYMITNKRESVAGGARSFQKRQWNNTTY